MTHFFCLRLVKAGIDLARIGRVLSLSSYVFMAFNRTHEKI